MTRKRKTPPPTCGEVIMAWSITVGLAVAAKARGNLEEVQKRREEARRLGAMARALMAPGTMTLH